MTKKTNDIVFTAALRTAIGRYEGMWKKYQAHDLGKTVIKNGERVVIIFGKTIRVLPYSG